MKLASLPWVLLSLLLPISSGASCQTKTLGEIASGYTYVPTDPFPVTTVAGENCVQLGGAQNEGPQEPSVDPRYVPLLNALPDNTVRQSVQQLEVGGGITFGSSAVTAKGSRYRAVVDYINATTVSVDMEITRKPRSGGPSIEEPEDPLNPVYPRQRRSEPSYDYAVKLSRDVKNIDPKKNISIPVYVGIGLRLTAQISASEANVNISGMSAVGAQAEIKHLSGTLVMQTLGVNGPRISAAMPIQTELNNTTVQNSMQALGVLKTLLYEHDTFVQPRVVGFYLPFEGEKELVNEIVTELLRPKAVRWERPCRVRPVAQGSGSEAGSVDSSKESSEPASQNLVRLSIPGSGQGNRHGHPLPR